MAIGEVYRLTRKGQIDGQAHVNVLHFLDTDGASANPEDDLADAWATPTPVKSVESDFTDLQRGFASWIDPVFEVQKVFPTEGDVEVYTFPSNPPTAMDTGLPTFAQVKISWLTERKDRSGRGGMYVGGIAEGETTGNTIGGAWLTQANDFVTAVERVFTAGGAEFSGFAIGVFSRLLLEFNVLTTAQVANTLGTMRSRRAGRGI